MNTTKKLIAAAVVSAFAGSAFVANAAELNFANSMDPAAVFAAANTRGASKPLATSNQTTSRAAATDAAGLDLANSFDPAGTIAARPLSYVAKNKVGNSLVTDGTPSDLANSFDPAGTIASYKPNHVVKSETAKMHAKSLLDMKQSFVE